MSTSRPLVSIIIATYNRSAFLTRAIRSALGQTLGDLEVIVVDDGSTDDTPAVLDAFEDDRLWSIRFPANQGACAACNAGIEAARSEVLLFLDSDDGLRPQAAGRLHGVLAADRGIGMAWGRKGIWDHATGSLQSVAFVDPFRRAGTDRLLPMMLTWTPGLGGLAVRREVFDTLGPLDAELSMGDLDLAIRFAACGRWKVQVVDEVTYDIYEHGPSLSSRVDTAYLRGIERLLTKHHEVLHSYPEAYASYLYRAAHASFCLDDSQGGHCYLNRAIRQAPLRPTYWGFKLAQLMGLAGAWRALSAARARRDARLRKSRHERENGAGQAGRGLMFSATAVPIP
ncbi:MAG: glycosyltransferase family 2 protein [Isosphaeraceae bacterium]|nr:glycosyltransferase family 2 protein [Isosphaeraceae bacterium]